MANGSEQPHLVSLVLQSKKALLHGEQLCSRARTLASTSAEVAGDVLALDAKLRFMTNAVLEQVKVHSFLLLFLCTTAGNDVSWLLVSLRALNSNEQGWKPKQRYVSNNPILC